jgi:hypothetical protein
MSYLYQLTNAPKREACCLLSAVIIKMNEEANGEKLKLKQSKLGHYYQST